MIDTVEAALDTPLTSTNRLSEDVKRAIVAAVAQGEQLTSVAKRFKTTRQTVHAICKPLRTLPDSPLNTAGDWRRDLTERLPGLSVAAMQASIQDRGDVHKAAGTAIQHLKGIGVLAGDNSVNVTIQAVIASIPQEWRDDMILTPQVLSVSDTPIAPPANTVDTTTGCVDLPTNGAPLIK